MACGMAYLYNDSSCRNLCVCYATGMLTSEKDRYIGKPIVQKYSS